MALNSLLYDWFREYPCEFVSLFVLCQMFSEDANNEIQQISLLLLQILRRQFLDITLSPSANAYLSQKNSSKQNENFDQSKASFFSSTKCVSEMHNFSNKRVFSLGQSLVIDQLSKTYIQLTMSIFSGNFLI